MGPSPGKVVNSLGKSEIEPDMVPGGELEHGVECDKRVNLSNMEGGGLEEDVQNRETKREERTEDEHEGKDEQPIDQCRRLQIVG